MAIPATQMRPGMIIKHKDQLHLVFKVEHRTPGNLRAFIQAKLRNIRTGAMFEERFRSADAIEKVVVDEVSMDFLYSDGDLARTITIRGEAHSVMQAINRQVAHYPHHVGQIVLLAKHFCRDEWQSLSVPRKGSAEFNRKVAAGEASQR